MEKKIMMKKWREIEVAFFREEWRMEIGVEARSMLL